MKMRKRMKRFTKAVETILHRKYNIGYRCLITGNAYVHPKKVAVLQADGFHYIDDSKTDFISIDLIKLLGLLEYEVRLTTRIFGLTWDACDMFDDGTPSKVTRELQRASDIVYKELRGKL